MTETTFRALVVHEEPAGENRGAFRRQVQERAVDDLPGNELLVRVHWSSLNYKDALSATGNKGVTRRYPTPRASTRPAWWPRAGRTSSGRATR